MRPWLASREISSSEPKGNQEDRECQVVTELNALHSVRSKKGWWVGSKNEPRNYGRWLAVALDQLRTRARAASIRRVANLNRLHVHIGTIEAVSTSLLHSTKD